MQSGLINKVALTPANITDAKGLKHVLPSSGAIYADKGLIGQKLDFVNHPYLMQRSPFFNK
jgi:hypothetical protein